MGPQTSQPQTTQSNEYLNHRQHQQQSEMNKAPNPTVNALILHTGNSAQNVNINIYADGQSGQSQTNQKNVKQRFHHHHHHQNKQTTHQQMNEEDENNEDEQTKQNDDDHQQQQQGDAAKNELFDQMVNDIAMGPRHQKMANIQMDNQQQSQINNQPQQQQQQSTIIHRIRDIKTMRFEEATSSNNKMAILNG